MCWGFEGRGYTVQHSGCTQERSSLQAGAIPVSASPPVGVLALRAVSWVSIVLGYPRLLCDVSFCP